MHWSLKSIMYWILLALSFLGGIFLIGSSLILWTFQKNYAFSIANIAGLSSGVALLLTFLIYFQSRKYFPLKKAEDLEGRADSESVGLTAFHPHKIELSTNLNGACITQSCGAPSPIRFRATQLSPTSDSREEDYERTFYNSISGEIVRYDESRPDHRELYEHFLWIINTTRRPVILRSYMQQYNIIKPKSNGEKRTETIH